jgi:phosphoglycerate dehydrogenase-like enzyme
MPSVIVTAEPMCRWEDGPHVRPLREAGFEIADPPETPPVDEDQTVAALRGVAAVIAGSEPYTERVLARLPGLRVISRCGVGCDRIDLEASARRGVAVAITPEGNYAAVAEHTLAMLLALARSIVRNDRGARRGLWIRTPLVPLRGKTLGIVGLGRIGRAVARRAVPFGLNLLGCDPRGDQGLARECGVELTGFDSLLARSDFVTLHVPLTPETRGLIGRAALARMKPGAFLVNTSRGGLVVEPDLVDALRSGRLAGAGLDVMVDEPPRGDNPLLALDNVLISPHVASNDLQAIHDMAEAAARNIVDIFRGRDSPESLVTPFPRPAPDVSTPDLPTDSHHKKDEP